MSIFPESTCLPSSSLLSVDFSCLLGPRKILQREMDVGTEEAKEGFFFFFPFSPSSSHTLSRGLDASRCAKRPKRFLLLYRLFVLSLALSAVNYRRRNETSKLFAEGHGFASRSDLSSVRGISRHQTLAAASSHSASSSFVFSAQAPVYSALEVSQAPGETEREEVEEETKKEEESQNPSVGPSESSVHAAASSRARSKLSPELSHGQRAPLPPSSSVAGSSPSPPPLGRPPRFPPSWQDWMTAQDKEGKTQLSRQCRRVSDYDARVSADPELIHLLDERIPEGSVMTVRVLSSDQEQQAPASRVEAPHPPPSTAVAGEPSTSSSSFSRGAEGGGGEEEEQGERRARSSLFGGGEQSLVAIRRGRVLGTGGEAIVVEGRVIEPSTAGRGRRGRPDSRASFFRLPRVFRTREREREERSSSPSASLSSSLFSSSASSRGSRERVIWPTVAVRFLVSSARLRLPPSSSPSPSSSSSFAQPFPSPSLRRRSLSDEAVARYVEEMHAEQEQLIKISRRFGGSDLLKNTYGFILPTLIGTLNLSPTILGQLFPRRRRAPGNRFLLNHVTIFPALKADLDVLLSNPNLGASSLVYVAKSLIRLAANLELFRLVHRDIKLENVLVDEAGNVFLSDFQFVKAENQSFTCREVVSTVFAEPWLALCAVKSPEFRMRAKFPYDAWMTGMAVFTWLCNDYPFQGMLANPWQATAAMQGGRQILTPRELMENNIAVVARLYNPAIALPESRHKKFLAPIDWSRCPRFPRIGSYPHLQDAVQGLLDVNPSTRLRPFEIVSTHPLFASEG